MTYTFFLPWRGEFGQMLMHHVRWIHADPAEFKVVCCRPGDEPLFPSAAKFFYNWEDAEDAQKKTKLLKSPENQEYLEIVKQRILQEYQGTVHPEFRYPLDGCAPQRRGHCPEGNFIPKPSELCAAPDIRPDILVAPRFRQHGAHRNFAYWDEVIRGLLAAGHDVGLIGAEETSLDKAEWGLPSCQKAWTYKDNLGITLHWMQTAKLVLTTDSGMAHLAVLACAPLHIIYGRSGVEAGHESWPWAFDHMRIHARAVCRPICEGWTDPQRVVREVEKFFGGVARGPR